MRSPRLQRLPGPPEGFRTGDAVEVLPEEPGFRGAHLAARVVRSHPNLARYTVEYDAIVDNSGDRPLRESVDARRVRPRPPPPAPKVFAEHDAVDAFFKDAWWLGVAVAIGGEGEGKVTVCFPETREVIEFDAANVRPHLEWVAGEWCTPESLETPKRPYNKGTQVEVEKLEGGSVAWFPAVVAKTIWKNSFLVEYTSVKNDGSTLPNDIVHLKHIRPRPPRASCIIFCINDEVEAFCDDGWWPGMISEVHPGSVYTLRSAHLGKEVQFNQKLLRLRYDWDHGQWQPVSQKTVKTKFTKGTKVEVSSDDEGFRGAWYEATVLKSVGRKYLVEYKTLRTEDESMPLTETVAEKHIRPSPPDIPVTEGFNYLDEVDSFYNDGWWVGTVSKISSNGRYTVYFKAWKEELEFGHEQLRIHCEWVGGRWMRAFPALEM